VCLTPHSKKINRKKLSIAWLLTSIASSVITAIITMMYWQFTYVRDANKKWQPIDDISAMLALMPLGWIISVLTPAGWLNITGFVLALYKISYKPLVICIAGSILFGLYWPKYVVGIMRI
jgi:TRAP-type C4-dicarboxylate transport system permease small subunit